MNDQAVRKALNEIRRDLQRNDEEREMLLALVKGYEAWLRLHGKSLDGSQLSFGKVAAAAGQVAVAVVGAAAAVSFRSALLSVLKEAGGEPLHTREILRRVRERGAVTMAKDPDAITDLQCYSLAKTEYVVKSAPRTWRYATRAEWEAWRRVQNQRASNGANPR